MSFRSIAAIILSVVVIVELIFFFNAPTPVTRTSSTDTLFGGSSEIDYAAQTNQTIMYVILIGATIVVGSIITFSLPKKSVGSPNSTKKNDESENQNENTSIKP